MAINYSNNGNAGTPSNSAMCTSNAAGGAMETREMSEAGGGTSVSGNIGPTTLGTDERVLHLASVVGEPGIANWAAGNWALSIHVSTGNSDISWTQTRVCRMDSGGTNVATIGSFVGPPDTVMDAGVQVNDAPVSGSSNNRLASDRFYVVAIMSDTRPGGSHGNVRIKIDDTDTEMDTPLVAQVAAGTYLRRYEHAKAPSIHLRR